MSREIKFRVWDKVNERMLNIETLGLSFSPNGVLTSIYTYGPDFSNDPEVIGHDEPDLDDVTIEQYTGLKDANGKEIYEGDVIKYFGANKRIKTKTTYGRVFYDSEHGCFNSRIQNEEHGKGGVSPLNDLVVGNIHENPELLEAQHDTRTD